MSNLPLFSIPSRNRLMAKWIEAGRLDDNNWLPGTRTTVGQLILGIASWYGDCPPCEIDLSVQAFTDAPELASFIVSRYWSGYIGPWIVRCKLADDLSIVPPESRRLRCDDDREL